MYSQIHRARRIQSNSTDGTVVVVALVRGFLALTSSSSSSSNIDDDHYWMAAQLSQSRLEVEER